MRRLMVALALCLCLLALGGPASAALLVDTGTPPVDSVGWSLSSDQDLASRFTLTSQSKITSLAGYMYSLYSSGTATVEIRSDGGGVPGADVLLSRSLLVPESYTPDWRGVHGLHTVLDAGDYWIVFLGGDDIFGGMPDPAPNPLLVEAYSFDGVWSNYNDLDIGVRVYGGPPVPEPCTMLLLGGGVLGLASLKRQRR